MYSAGDRSMSQASFYKKTHDRYWGNSSDGSPGPDEYLSLWSFAIQLQIGGLGTPKIVRRHQA